MKFKTVILDIDRTLVHSVINYRVKEEWKNKFETYRFDDYTVFLRPNVREFIDFLFNNGYKVGIFTAASSEYANFIVNTLFKDKDLLFMFSEIEYRDSLKKYNKEKPLEFIVEKFPSIGECVIIDDSSSVKRSNGDMCYQIRLFAVCYDDTYGFYEPSIEDKELIKCMEWL